MLKPIKGMIAIAVDEDGKWVAMGGDNDPGAKDSANSARECLYDTGHVGMIQVYLKPVEFWPATVETLGDKPLIQNTTEMSLIENFDESVSMLFGDGEATIDHEIAKALEKLKSLVRLRAYVKSEVSYYETDSHKTAEDSVKEAMALCGGNGQSVIKHSVERKVEQTHKETVTITSSSAADRIAEVVAASPGTVFDIEQEADLDGVDVQAILAKDSRFVHRARRWWVNDSLPKLRHRDGESLLDAYARQLAEFIAKFGPVSQTDANKILKIPTARIVAIRDNPPFATDGCYRLCLAENLPEDKRYNYVHSEPTEDENDEEPEEIDEPEVQLHSERSWDDVSDDEIAAFMTKAKKGSDLSNHFGCQRSGVDERLRRSDRFIQSHVWWKLRDQGTNGTTAAAKADNTTRAGERPVETHPARLSSRQVEIKPCDKCGGPLGDGIRPFVCPVCDVSKTIDTVDDSDSLPVSRSVDRADPRGQTAGQIESYIRQRVRQSKNGMMLIRDIAEELDVGEGAVADVARKMDDMSFTGQRVMQKLVRKLS